MKAITIWQPRASLLACGAKIYETRSWMTSYRGPIAIHAAARKCDTDDMSGAAVYAAVEAIRPITRKLAKTAMYVPFELLPRGAIIATADLVECWKIDAIGHVVDGSKSAHITGGPFHGKGNIISGKEILFGNWTPGRYAWEFANMTMLPEPIPAKGKQRLWEWEAK